MPYRLVRKDDKYCVAKEDGAVISGGCHATRKKALAHMRALYSNEGNMKDTMIIFGGQVKALGKGKVGGPIITFSGPDDPDLIHDFFTKDTEFFIEDGARLPVLYEHGFNPEVKRAKLGTVMVKFKPDGLYGEAEIDLATEHGKKIYERVTNDELYWSSGAAGHMVARHEIDNKKAHWIAEWGLAEASLVDSPAEYRNEAITLKSFIESRELKDDCGCDDPPIAPVKSTSLAARLSQYIDDSVEEGRDRGDIVKHLAREAMMESEEVEKILTGEYRRPSNAKLKAFSRVLDLPFETLRQLADKGTPKSIKGMFEDELAGRTPSRWELDSVYCSVVKKIAEAAQKSAAAGSEYEYENRISEATDEYILRLKSGVISQVKQYIEAGAESPEGFYLKAITDPAAEDFISAKNLDIADHRSVVVSANASFVARQELNHEARVKSGRVLSEKNRQEVKAMMDDQVALVGRCQRLLDASKPMATDSERRAAETSYLRNQWRSRQTGATTNVNQ